LSTPQPFIALAEQRQMHAVTSDMRGLVPSTPGNRGKPREGPWLDNLPVWSQVSLQLEPLQNLVALPRRVLRMNQLVARIGDCLECVGILEQVFNLVHNVMLINKDAILHVHKAGRLEGCGSLGDQARPTSRNLEMLSDEVARDRAAGRRNQ
jgi:hypothetical protein